MMKVKFHIESSVVTTREFYWQGKIIYHLFEEIIEISTDHLTENRYIKERKFFLPLFGVKSSCDRGLKKEVSLFTQNNGDVIE